MAGIEVAAEDLARVAANALAFIPANSQIDHARLEIDNELRMTGTDTYAVGQARCELAHVAYGCDFTIARGDLIELEKFCREHKKRIAELLVSDGKLFIDCGTEEEPTALSMPYGSSAEPIWGAVDDLLVKLENRDPTLPQVIAFDPKLLTRFAKVKADKTDRIMDLYMVDSESPVLVKIGTDFIGAIMPINREIHAENVGEDGLW